MSVTELAVYRNLGFRFNVRCSSVSRVFVYVLDVPYVKLKPLIIWPDMQKQPEEDNAYDIQETFNKLCCIH